MELHSQPINDAQNKFVITENKACFLPYSNRSKAPQFVEILGEIFDLSGPEYEKVDKKLSKGRIILGYYDPSTEEIDIHLPLEISDYVQNRINEVFDV